MQYIYTYDLSSQVSSLSLQTRRVCQVTIEKNRTIDGSGQGAYNTRSKESQQRCKETNKGSNKYFHFELFISIHVHNYNNLYACNTNLVILFTRLLH